MVMDSLMAHPVDERANGIAAVLFDLDETLIGSGTAHLGRIVSLLHERLPEQDAAARPSTVERLAARLYERLRRRVVLNPEARRVLDALQRAGLPFGIVTNGSEQKRHTLHLLGLDRHAACIIVSGAGGGGRRKPDTAIFDQAAERLGTPPEAILFVGDKPRVDIRGAREAGMKTAWLRRGRMWPLSATAGADVTLKSIVDVLDVVGIGASATR